jgi:hypothetical protein
MSSTDFISPKISTVKEKTMKNIDLRRQLRKAALGAVVLGTAAFAGFPHAANAAAREVKEAHHDVKEAKRDVKDAKRDVHRADTHGERRDAREDLRDTREDKRDAHQDLRQEKREDQRDKDRRDNNRHDDHWNDNHRDNNRNYGPHRGPVYNPGHNGNFGWNNRSNTYNTYTGVVTRVESSRSFAVRANGQTFDVYTDAGLPRGFDKGDTVRVYGVRSGGNDIRNASVSIINNR